MKTTKTTIIALLTIVTATASYGWAQTVAPAPTPVPVPVSHKFKLKTKAVLSIPGSPTISPLIFVGPGKAKADAHGVTIEFDVLHLRHGRGKAKIRLNNPLGYTGTRRNFSGRGIAKVRLVNRSFRFRIAIKGLIKRTADGRLLIHGKYRSVHPTVSSTSSPTRRCAKLKGRFSGISR